MRGIELEGEMKKKEEEIAIPECMMIHLHG